MSISKTQCANRWRIMSLAAWLGAVLTAVPAANSPADPYDNQDLGDGYTPVTLHLPFKKAGKIQLHKLAGDPRASNREKMTIDIQTQDVPASALADGAFLVNESTGGGAHGMPPGSIFLYVFEAAQ